jgi:hypothetical protein
MENIRKEYEIFTGSDVFMICAIEFHSYDTFVWLYENDSDFDEDIISYALECGCLEIAAYLYEKEIECSDEEEKIIKEYIEKSKKSEDE